MYLHNNQKIMNKLAQILMAKRLKMPFVCVDDPLEFGSVFIQNSEKGREIEMDGLVIS